MHNLLLDITRLFDRALQKRLPTGVDRVCMAYVRRYHTVARAVVFYQNCVWIFPRNLSQKLFDLLLNPPWNLGTRLLRIIVFQGAATWFPSRLKDAILLNLGHSNIDRAPYLRSLRRRKIKLVCFVHDLIPLTHPEYCRPAQFERHRHRIQQALLHSTGILTNSQATLDDLATFAKSAGLPLPPSAPALLAPDPSPAPASERPMREPYFVMVGTIEPRKNYAFILQVWRQLVQKLGPDHTPRLVLIGQRGWECENIIDLLERSHPIRGIVLERNKCSDADLATLLHHSQALLFPSFAEGYGLPIAEALTAGIPVIASDLPVFREFADCIPEYIDPLNGPLWTETITDYSRPESALRHAQMERLNDFRPPTWDAHFQAVDALLAALVHSSAPALPASPLP